MNIDQFRESLGVVEFGIEFESDARKNRLMTIRTMDVLLGIIAAGVIWSIAV